MPKANDGAKPGDDATQNKGGKNTDDATGKKAGQVDNLDDDDNDGDPGSEKPKGKFMTDDEINSIVQRRLSRATKESEDKAKLSKEQLLEKERDDARNELRIANARDGFIAASGLEYSKASRLFRVYSNDLEFDDKGKATNVKDVLKEAKSEWPELFGEQQGKKKGDADLGGGNGDHKKGVGGMNSAIRRAAGRD